MDKMSFSSRNKGHGRQGTLKKIGDKTSDKTPTSDSVSLNATSHKECDAESMMIEKMRKLCEENTQGHKRTVQTLERQEKAVTDIKGQLGDHQRMICKLEGRVSGVEDSSAC